MQVQSQGLFSTTPYIVLLLLPLPALAEVSDKMPSQQNLWLSGLVLAVAMGFAVRRSRWFNLLAWPLVMMFFYGAYDLLNQADVGLAIVHEQGGAYVFASYGSAVLVLVGVVVGNVSTGR